MAREVTSNSEYADRLLKLIPSEFIVAYVAITESIKDYDDFRQPVLIVCLVLFTILIPVYLKKIQGVGNILQIGLTALSFIVWAYTLGDAFQPGPWVSADLHVPALGSVLMILSTTMTPMFVKAKE